MRKHLTLRNILAFFGVLFLLELAGIAAFMAYGASQDASSQRFAETSIEDIGRQWRFDELKRRAHPILFASATVEATQNIFALLGRLGTLQSSPECEGQAGFNFGKNQPRITAQYACRAIFEKDTAIITLGLVKDEEWKIANFNVNSDYLVKQAQNPQATP